jgi:hypothetical protein
MIVPRANRLGNWTSRHWYKDVLAIRHVGSGSYSHLISQPFSEWCCGWTTYLLLAWWMTDSAELGRLTLRNLSSGFQQKTKSYPLKIESEIKLMCICNLRLTWFQRAGQGTVW